MHTRSTGRGLVLHGRLHLPRAGEGGGDHRLSPPRRRRRVASGWDTDSNGATAGSIIGVMLGTAAIPTHWTDPLGDAVDTALVGRGRQQLSELAAATAAVARHLKE
ncbi:MAG: ADP-ribosylglycohydrolase family protein [Acidimicrobiia bacterium]